MTSAQQAGASGAEGTGAAWSGSLSPEQIEERLRAQREDLAASVDEFASRHDPRTPVYYKPTRAHETDP